jgi:hypothetical protein
MVVYPIGIVEKADVTSERGRMVRTSDRASHRNCTEAMSTNDFAGVEPCDTTASDENSETNRTYEYLDSILDQARDQATDESDDKLYTRHREPEKVGGERYWRCEECSGESIFGRDSILHYEGCSEGDRL